MNIALVHFRVGELDGVSLEMDKWYHVLKTQYGYRVIYLAGSLGKTNGHIIPEFSLEYPIAMQIRQKAFSSVIDKVEEKILEDKILSISNKIQPKITEFIEEYKIVCFIVNNMFSLPLNIPASLALLNVIKNTGIFTISHNHDFFWERTINNPSCPFIQDYLEKYFPPILSNIQHVVINSLAKKVLVEKKGIKSHVVPNVFYFEEPLWKEDSFNSDLRTTLNIDKNDIIVLQATRIVARKGIELIIDLISEINKPNNIKKLTSQPLYDERRFQHHNKIILVMPNLVEDISYKNKLEKKCQELNVEYRFCNNKFAHERSTTDNKSKIYNLWDIYTQADIVSYPSLQEGWGNQFLEAVKAKVPIILFEYDVYKEDIGPSGFKIISLGSNIQKTDNQGLVSISSRNLQNAAQNTINMLQNKAERKKVVESNYNIGLKKLSLSALGEYLKPLIS